MPQAERIPEWVPDSDPEPENVIHLDTPAEAPPPAPGTRKCERIECRNVIHDGQYPQCLRCLEYHLKPCDFVTLVGVTPARIRMKRQLWLRDHRGWSLLPKEEYTKVAPPRRSTPMGLRLHVATYIVIRGRSSVV